jgi:hypothetical protein
MSFQKQSHAFSPNVFYGRGGAGWTEIETSNSKFQVPTKLQTANFKKLRSRTARPSAMIVGGRQYGISEFGTWSFFEA